MARRVREGARRRTAAAAAVLAVLALPAAAHAQRGGDYIEQERASETPRRGFPGAFNTHMPEDDSVVANLPFAQIDYGVTENLALGANVLPTLPALAGETPGAIARLRYRLYERGPLSAVAALQVGYVPLSFDDEALPDRGWGAYASTTVGYQLSERQRLAGTLLATTIRLSNAAYRERSRFDAIGLALDYELFLTDALGLEVTAIGAPVITSGFDGPGESSSITFNLPVQDRVAVRALGLLRLGDTWLLEAGALAPLSFAATTPWLAVTKIW